MVQRAILLCFVSMAYSADEGCTYELTADSLVKFEAACHNPTILEDFNDIFTGNKSMDAVTELTCTKNCPTADPVDEPCIAMCYKTTDKASTQMWAVSFFFVNLVLAVAIGILFMSNSTPATTPPYNKFVFALLVLAAIQIVISWCGMAPSINAFAVSGAAVAFCVFSLLCAIVIGVGFWRSGPGVM